jgi:SAM-dependent methyltransferase
MSNKLVHEARLPVIVVPMKRVQGWLDVCWEFAGARLPSAPASVIEIGCGTSGGLVPRLTAAGYRPIGVDPKAPEEAGYVSVEFEEYQPPSEVDAIIAGLSLHHVADLDAAIGHAAAALRPGGTIVVIEMAHERLDEKTAHWCFDRLSDDEEPGWLHHHRDQWRQSGQSWQDYLDGWARQEGLHRADTVLAALDTRFEPVSTSRGPYLFPELDATTAADEQAAIDAGEINAVGVWYHGSKGTGDTPRPN